MRTYFINKDNKNNMQTAPTIKTIRDKFIATQSLDAAFTKFFWMHYINGTKSTPNTNPVVIDASVIKLFFVLSDSFGDNMADGIDMTANWAFDLGSGTAAYFSFFNDCIKDTVHVFVKVINGITGGIAFSTSLLDGDSHRMFVINADNTPGTIIENINAVIQSKHG